MRDSRKDKKYFLTYLEYQYTRIEKKILKLEESDDEKKQRVLMSLTGYEIDLLKAEFSAGASKESLKKLFVKITSIASEYKKITFEDLLVLLSLSVILGEAKATKKLIQESKKAIESDRLLKYLASFIETGEAIWNEKIQIRKEYVLLNDVFKAANKENAMLVYLDHWYDNHVGYAWYDSHLGDEDTYCGYWSFEAAAIGNILNLDARKLKKSSYYPAI